MNRLQKKCFIAATGFHLLLLLILLVGPAFRSSHRRPDDSQTITMVDLSRLTDGPTTGGGSPVAAPPKIEPPAPPPPPAPPLKTLIEKIFEPATPKPAPVVKADPESVEPAQKKAVAKDTADNPKPKKPTIEVSTKIVKRSATPRKPSPVTADDSEAKQQREAAREFAAAARRAASTLASGLSNPTEVFVPGPGAGAFVNYAEAVRIKYTGAWIAPDDAQDEEATVKVSVTIARDGSVISARVKTPSGDAATNRSVEQTLRRVTFIAPFPEGATDAERTFIINFNLKAKRSLG